MYSLVVIIIKEKGPNFGWIIWLGLIEMLIVGIGGGVMFFPQIALNAFLTWYFYLSAFFALGSSVVFRLKDFKGLKSWLIGAEIIAIFNTIFTVAFNKNEFFKSGIIMCITMIICAYTAFFLLGMIISLICSLISYKTDLPNVIHDKFSHIKQ